MPTYAFEAVSLNPGGVAMVVVRVPDEVLGASMKLGAVTARAEHHFGRPVLVLAAQSGRIAGNPHHKRLLMDACFDPDAAPWVQWNMEE